MTRSRAHETGDAVLGMGERVTRRDFLNAAALAAGGALSLSPRELLAARDDWTGYGGVGDYRFANGNTKDVMDAAHAIRDRRFETLPRDTIDTGEVFDLVVVGGGLTGLAAALFFERSGIHSREASGGSGGCAASTPQLDDDQEVPCHSSGSLKRSRRNRRHPRRGRAPPLPRSPPAPAPRRA